MYGIVLLQQILDFWAMMTTGPKSYSGTDLTLIVCQEGFLTRKLTYIRTHVLPWAINAIVNNKSWFKPRYLMESICEPISTGTN